MLFVVTIAILLVSVNAKFYSDCGSKLATVEFAEVVGCKQDAAECILKRNTNATINITFKPTKDVKSVEAVVHGIVMTVPVPFPLPQPDACQGCGLVCPLKTGEESHYTTSLPILGTYPKIEVPVRWELKDENGEDLVCLLFQARLR